MLLCGFIKLNGLLLNSVEESYIRRYLTAYSGSNRLLREPWYPKFSFPLCGSHDPVL